MAGSSNYTKEDTSPQKGASGQGSDETLRSPVYENQSHTSDIERDSRVMHQVTENRESETRAAKEKDPVRRLQNIKKRRDVRVDFRRGGNLKRQQIIIDLNYSLIDQKLNRDVDIPTKIYDLIRLPDTNDYNSFRDKVFYDQLSGEDYSSTKWPDLAFGADDRDLIRVCVYGKDGGTISIQYFTKDQIESSINSSMPGKPAVVKLNAGKILRDLGFRRGRFTVKFDFLRLQAGSPFPILVNGDDKIFRGKFYKRPSGYFHSTQDDEASGTLEGDKLFVKENKFIVQQISGDRTEIILSPAFINDAAYLEDFRMAAYNCLNWFPDEDPVPIAIFESPNSQLVSFNTSNNLPMNFMNGTIRINNAYFMGKRIINEIREFEEFFPSTDILQLNPNLLHGRTMNSLFGWRGGGPWPNAGAVVPQGSVEGADDTRTLRLESVVEPNPSGQFAIKVIFQNPLNFDATYLGTPLADGGAASGTAPNHTPRSENAIVNTNLQFGTVPYVPLPGGMIPEGTIMTFSCYVKANVGDKIRFLSHADPWGVSGATKYSQWWTGTGEWERLHYTFTLENTSLNSKILMRTMWDPRANFNPSLPGNIEQYHFFTAGAQLETGAVLTPFHLAGEGDELFLESPIDTILTFEDPDGKIIIGDLVDGDEFKQLMIGGKLLINNAHPTLDLTTEFTVSELETEEVYEWDVSPSDGPSGNVSQGGAIQEVYEHSQTKIDADGNPLHYPFPDEALNSQAIMVANDMGVRRWTGGFSSLSWSSRFVGTANIGYHAQWRAGKGIDGGPAMCFPDLNYQDYIYDDMVQARRNAGNVFGRTIPTEDVFEDKNNFAHRNLQIYTSISTDLDAQKMGIGSLAAYGVRSGDQVKISWMQKSDPIDFHSGGRKGLWVGLNHWTSMEVSPPDVPQVLDTELWEEDNAFHLFYGGDDDFEFWDEGLNDQAVYINRKPTYLEPDWDNTSEFETFLGSYSTQVSYANGYGGWYTKTDGELAQSEAFKWYWSHGSDPEEGEWIINRLAAAIWPGETDARQNVFRVGSSWSPTIVPTSSYPSRDDYPTSNNISSDGVFIWNGTEWVIAIESGRINWATEFEVEGDNVTLYKRTYRLESMTEGPSSIYHPKCEEYNQWEAASFTFEITDFFALDQEMFIECRGHYGSFGTVWADKFNMSIIKSSLLRPEVQENATLGDLEFEIVDVISENKIEVNKTYNDASSDQGGIVSSYGINKYSNFDKGFSVDYITQPSGSQDIFARYEGKILDVINDDLNYKKLVLNKSYTEYGEEIGAVMTGPDAIDITGGTFNDYFIRYRSKDADNLYTYVVTGTDKKSLIINFKPVASETYPGGIAYKLMEPIDAGIEPLDLVYIAEEVTPTLRESIDLNPFIEEKLPPTVLRQPNWADVDIPIRNRATEYKSHTDLIGSDPSVRAQLEDRILSGSLETVNINVDYRQFANFIHFSSAEKRIDNFKYKLGLIEQYAENSASLTGTGTTEGYLGNAAGTGVSASAGDVAKWEISVRETVNSFDDFENYMYFQSSSYITSSMGEFFANTPPKYSGAGDLVDPYIMYSITGSNFTTWYDSTIANAILYDRNNNNRLVNLLPEHISSDKENLQFLYFMDMMGHHYDLIWTHIKALSDIHDRSEDVTKGISQALVEPVAKSLGFDMIEGRDLVSLPQYHLGLAESGSRTGIYNVRYTKKSQKDVTREIWNRILATMPYMLKSKGTKQSLKALIAAYGIPTSILRIQEYGGPRPTGKPDFEIKKKFTKALDFGGGQYVHVPWYHTNKLKVPDTIEMRFKTSYEADQILAQKFNTSNKTEAAIYIKTSIGAPVSSVTMDAQGSGYTLSAWVTFSGGGGTGASGILVIHPATGKITGITLTSGGYGYTSIPTVTIHQDVSDGSGAIATAVLGAVDQNIDGKGQVSLLLSGSNGAQSILSLSDEGVFNNEYWSLMVRRRTGSMDDSYTDQYFDNDLTATTQSFDMFLGYYDSGTDKIVVQTSGSMDVSGSALEGWYTTGSEGTLNNRWYVGGLTDTDEGEQFVGSMMEFRYWQTPLNAGAFWNHVAAPKAINGNHISSSYYDLSLRLSFDDYINLNSSPYGLKDYTFTDAQIYVTGSGFADEINFSNVTDRQKSFVPKIGFGSQANKIRIESATLRSPDGGIAHLSPTERVEISSFDNAGLDSNKLGIFFAPSDVINEDIMLSLADMDFSSYLGDPRDMYEDRYKFGGLDNVTDTYWKKWTTKQGFWDYIKLIKYYDLSLFEHIRKLSPARAKKNIGLLIESHLLERPKVVVGAPPVFKDIAKSAKIDSTYPEPKSLNEYRTAAVSASPKKPKSSYELRSGAISETSFEGKTTGSRHDFSTIGLSQIGLMSSERDEFETAAYDTNVGPTTYMQTLKSFSADPLTDPLSSTRDYTEAQVFMGGGSSVFFETFQPMITSSRLSYHNQETVLYYNTAESASLGLAYSSSLKSSEYESLYNGSTGLFNLAYAGCKNDGSRSPDGILQAVEIYDVNPYSVKVDKIGNKNLTVDLSGE